MSESEIILYAIGGMIMLFVGAEGLIRGSSNLAIKVGITPLIVGLTVVAFGTSAPEFVVSLNAAIKGNASISLGNVVGSNIANIALILGVAAIIRPLSINANVIRREIPVMIGVSLLFIFLFLDSKLGVIDGVIFLMCLIFYLIINVIIAKKGGNSAVNIEYNESLKGNLGVSVSIVFIVIGLAILILGSNLFVQSAVAIARLFGVSDAVIGLTIVAVGTSLPELITSIIASYKKEADIAIGNVVGSNIFNILGILGITAIITPISAGGINYIDLGIMIITAIILIPLGKSGFSISRIEGLFLIAGYVVYIYYLLPK